MKKIILSILFTFNIMVPMEFKYKSFENEKTNESRFKSFKNTDLFDAAYLCDNSIILELLNYGIDINIQDQHGWSSLIWVINSVMDNNDKRDTVKLLLSKGADISLKDERNWTALHHAVFSGHVEITKILLENGANINDKDENGWTALNWVKISKSSQDIKQQIIEFLQNKENVKFTVKEILLN